MRIHNKVSGLWFVFQARVADDIDEIVLCPFKELISFGGQFSWVRDMRGIFTTKKEAEKFFKQQKVKP